MNCKTGVAGGLLALAVGVGVAALLAGGRTPDAVTPSSDAPAARVASAGDAVNMTDWRETGDENRRRGGGGGSSTVIP